MGRGVGDGVWVVVGEAVGTGVRVVVGIVVEMIVRVGLGVGVGQFAFSKSLVEVDRADQTLLHFTYASVEFNEG